MSIIQPETVDRLLIDQDTMNRTVLHRQPHSIRKKKPLKKLAQPFCVYFFPLFLGLCPPRTVPVDTDSDGAAATAAAEAAAAAAVAAEIVPWPILSGKEGRGAGSGMLIKRPLAGTRPHGSICQIKSVKPAQLHTRQQPRTCPSNTTSESTGVKLPFPLRNWPARNLPDTVAPSGQMSSPLSIRPFLNDPVNLLCVKTSEQQQTNSTVKALKTFRPLK